MNRRPLSPVAVCLVLIACLPTLLAVSYTHLTLPTSDLV